MDLQAILDDLDRQFAQLRHVRALIAGLQQPGQQASGAGRPKGSTNKKTATAAAPAKETGKHTMSAEGRARVAAAQKARWVAQKKAAEPVQPPAKKSTAKSKPAPKKAAPAKKTPQPSAEEPTTDA